MGAGARRVRQDNRGVDDSAEVADAQRHQQQQWGDDRQFNEGGAGVRSNSRGAALPRPGFSRVVSDGSYDD
jgi:hypothetical protein